MKKTILLITSLSIVFNAALGVKPGGKKEWLDYEDAKKMILISLFRENTAAQEGWS